MILLIDELLYPLNLVCFFMFFKWCFVLHRIKEKSHYRFIFVWIKAIGLQSDHCSIFGCLSQTGDRWTVSWSGQLLLPLWDIFFFFHGFSFKKVFVASKKWVLYLSRCPKTWVYFRFQYLCSQKHYNSFFFLFVLCLCHGLVLKPFLCSLWKLRPFLGLIRSHFSQH